MNPETLLQDIRFGCRLLCRTPGFTAAAVVTLDLACILPARRAVAASVAAGLRAE